MLEDQRSMSVSSQSGLIRLSSTKWINYIIFAHSFAGFELEFCIIVGGGCGFWLTAICQYQWKRGDHYDKGRPSESNRTDPVLIYTRLP